MGSNRTAVHGVVRLAPIGVAAKVVVNAALSSDQVPINRSPGPSDPASVQPKSVRTRSGRGGVLRQTMRGSWIQPPFNEEGARCFAMRARTSSVAAPLHASPSLSVLRPGMKLFVHGPQIVAIDVGIELRGREVGVAEHLLHRPEIRPALEEMRRERVT